MFFLIHVEWNNKYFCVQLNTYIAHFRQNVTTQNLAFLSYWYRKKRLADALLTGIVS